MQQYNNNYISLSVDRKTTTIQTSANQIKTISNKKMQQKPSCLCDVICQHSSVGRQDDACGTRPLSRPAEAFRVAV